MEARKSSSRIYFKFLAILLCEISITTAGGGYKTSNLGGVLPTFSSSSANKENMQRRLLKTKGHEVIPMGSNAIPGEPSCEELRAMWRYYKRQSRAELTNEIPQFGTELFWDILPVQQQKMASFGPFRGRNKSRFRMKNPRQSLYGKVTYKPERERGAGRRRRPIDEIIRKFGMSQGRNTKVNGDLEGETPGVNGAQLVSISEPVLHFSPPPAPTRETSFQKLKEIFREERIKEKGPAVNSENKEYGKVVLSPPEGQDGRVANKPKELMTPFEKIRFGHADDILDEGMRPNLDLMKRRTLPLAMLKVSQNTLRRNRQQAPAPVLVHRSQPYSTDFWSVSSKDDQDELNNNNIESSIDYDSQSSPYQSSSLVEQPSNTHSTLAFNGQQNMAANPAELIVESNPNTIVNMPTCPEVEGQFCAVNSDCSCVGFGLYRCYYDQCQVLSLYSAIRGAAEMNGEISSVPMWHSEPVKSTQLGLWEENPMGNLSPDSNTNTNNKSP